jgi:hypothetical protein
MTATGTVPTDATLQWGRAQLSVASLKCRLKERPFCRHIGCVSVEQVQTEIAKLPPEDFRKLADWMDERRAQDWDRRIEEDAKSGKLDKLYEKLQAENQGAKAIALNDFLDEQKLP